MLRGVTSIYCDIQWSPKSGKNHWVHAIAEIEKGIPPYPYPHFEIQIETHRIDFDKIQSI